MGRFVSATSLVCVLAACSLLISCSSGSSTRVTNNQVPASISLTPGNISLEPGKTAGLTPSARNSAGTSLTETFTFQSSNPSVVTVGANGNACAGTWDSLTVPVVCTPGSTGIATVTAFANGVASIPVTVYVHQHVTRIVIQKVPNQPPTLSSACLSKGVPTGPESVLFEAFAFAGTSGTNDITQTVGPYNWGAASVSGQSSTSSPVSLSFAGATAPLNQEIATASTPGTTSIFATAGGVTSQPLPFTTCPVQTISLSVPGNSSSTTSFLLSSGTSLSVNATVRDSIGMTLTGIPLTWTSTNQQSVTVTGAPNGLVASVGSVTGAAAGSAAVSAACTPPSCNGGIAPSMPIYPTDALNIQVTGATSSSRSLTTYVTTTACGSTTQACTTRIVPITRSGTTSTFAAGSPANLPFAPNSLLFGPANASLAYLGVDDAGFGTQGLMIFSGSSASQLNGAAGRVLAVSPDSSTVILSDTTDSPSRVNICKNCNSNSRTLVPILMPNATAAAFSPDGLKAYIVSGTSCPGSSSAGCLLVYSQVDSPQFISLSAPANAAAFIGNGSVGYTAETMQTSSLPTCGPSAAGSLGSVGLPGQMLRTLPDGMSLLALTPPDLQTVTATITGPQTPPANTSGCPSPRGFLNITNTLGPSVNLGVGSFTPTQFFLSPNGDVAYILGRTAIGSTTAPLPFVISFSVTAGTTSLISLAGSALPLSASLNGTSNLLVGADDGAVHVIDTTTGLDTQQVMLPFPQNSLCIAPGNPATQVFLSSLTISAAQQSGTSTTFAYNLLNGSVPLAGESVVIAGMSDAGNNGTFTITAVNAATSSTGTITVANAAGVSANGQNGTGTVPLTCNPDLVATTP